MIKVRNPYLVIISLMFVSHFAKAANISISDLPSGIQTCVISGSCDYDRRSISDNDHASMFNYYDLVNNTTGKLIRYSLVDSQKTIDGVASNLSGAVWLQASDIYDLSAPMNYLTLHFDQVSPSPVDVLMGLTAPPTSQLGLTGTALIAGSGYLNESFITDTNLFVEGNLETDSTTICAAEGCSSEILFNLLSLNYYSAGTNALLVPELDSTDNRSILLSRRSSLYSYIPEIDFDNQQVFAVQTVPVPAAMWLFGSGLLGLFSFARRNTLA